MAEFCIFVTIFFYLRRQLAAGQVMGQVVVVVVVVVLVFKTYLNISRWSRQRRQGSWKGGSNPEESFIREVRTFVRHVLARCQDFLRGWIPESQGIQPRRKFYTRSQDLCGIGLGKVSRLSSGLDP